MVWVQIPSREEKNLTAQKSNSNTVWFNFQTYIYIYIKSKGIYQPGNLMSNGLSRHDDAAQTK